MLVWEAHLALADAIGDSTLINANEIRDGVRFSKSLRDSYLYRAMLSVLNKRLLQLKQLSNQQIQHIANRFFPTSIHQFNFHKDTPPDGSTGIALASYRYQLVFNDTTKPHPALILGGRLLDDDNTSNKPFYPLPHKTVIEASGLLNGLNVQDYDSFMVSHFIYNSSVFECTIDIFSSMLNFLTGSMHIQLDCILMPNNPADLGPTDTLLIDEAFIPEVINQAITYMMVDSQDIEITPAYSQFNQEIDKLMLGIPQQGG